MAFIRTHFQNQIYYVSYVCTRSCLDSKTSGRSISGVTECLVMAGPRNPEAEGFLELKRPK